jgi:hypothetical protein
VLGLQGIEHAAEVVADKVFEQLLSGVLVVDLVLCEDLIGELGAGLESQTLRLAERVVAVEEDVLDLRSIVC